MPFPRFPRLGLPRRRIPAAVLALALSSTLAATLLLWANARARDQARFDSLVRQTSDRIERRLDAYVALLSATAGLFASQAEITPDEFETYVRLLDVQADYPGIQGLGFSLRFPAEAREEVERKYGASSKAPGFQVWPADAESELHSIVMLEPRDERNRAALGYNMHSEPVRRKAMDRARDTGKPALSGKVTLKQEIDAEKQAGFLLYQPVYRGQPQSLAERREQLLGFVYSPFRAGDLLTGIFGGEPSPQVAFAVYDGTAPLPEQLLVRSHAAPADGDAPKRTATTRLLVGGEPWTLVFRSLPAYDETTSGRLVLPFLFAGILLSLALYWVTRAQVRARGEAERAAEELLVALGERAKVEEKLREGDRRKDEFLAMLAHELRNPMTPMLTAVELMGRKLGAGSELSHEREILNRQVHVLRRLVDDLLDVSRVTRGKILLQKVPLELVAASRRALEAARPFAEERRHTLRADLPDEALWAEADPVRFEQVLQNLLHNAAKYSEPGGVITLQVKREASQAVLNVLDTGVGISPEALPKLFEPFMQLGRTLDRSQGGLGLGLALVKRLVELHGGQVLASSPGAGKGSVFTVRLPLLDRLPQAAASGAAEPEAQRAGQHLRVLVVDDNQDAALLLAEALEMDGHRVQVANEGTSALERAASFAPQAVFLDIGLPGMDGYEVARRLRQRPGGERLRVVAVTGYGQASDLQRSREAGFDAHLVKPVELESVREQLRLVAEPPAASAAQEQPAPDAI